MKRTKLLQELRKMRFEQAWKGWSEGRLSQFEVRGGAIVGCMRAQFSALLQPL